MHRQNTAARHSLDLKQGGLTAITRLLPLLLLLFAGSAPGNPSVHVAVATNFRPLLEQLNPQFETTTRYRVTMSSGATGALYHQIRSGAPFDIFLAADQRTPELLAEQFPAAVTRSQCYARGRLALVGEAANLTALADPTLSLAIANPVTAPYGAAAEQVLSRPEFGTGAGRKLVRGNNAMQAFQFWHTGGVDLALVPLSLAKEQALEIPAAWHAAIDQYALLLPGARDNQAAVQYFEWLVNPTTQAAIAAAGYDPCP